MRPCRFRRIGVRLWRSMRRRVGFVWGCGIRVSICLISNNGIPSTSSMYLTTLCRVSTRHRSPSALSSSPTAPGSAWWEVYVCLYLEERERLINKAFTLNLRRYLSCPNAFLVVGCQTCTPGSGPDYLCPIWHVARDQKIHISSTPPMAANDLSIAFHLARCHRLTRCPRHCLQTVAGTTR